MEWLVGVDATLDVKQRLETLEFEDWNAELDGSALFVVLPCARYPEVDDARRRGKELIEDANLRLAVRTMTPFDHAEYNGIMNKRYHDGRRDVTVETSAFIGVIEASIVEKSDGTVTYWPNEITLERLYLDHFEGNPTVREAIKFLTISDNPKVSLYKVYEIVMLDVGSTVRNPNTTSRDQIIQAGRKKIVVLEWTNEVFLQSFTSTVNRAGPNARHALYPPPAREVDDGTAFAELRRVVKKWLLWKRQEEQKTPL